ncbi:glycosyltransferase [Marinobacter sp.]|uniref:glycosyltransferase n=1 Tax=Marinobacter sp. TaxID=50741 RepID=UPI0034A189E7
MTAAVRPVVTHVISGDLWAGAEVQVFNLCQALQSSGEVDVTVVVFNHGVLHEKLTSLGIPVTLADERKLGSWAIAIAISRHCKRVGSQIVHTHGFKENVLGIIGKELSRTPASVRTVHGNPEIRLSLTRPDKWIVNKIDLWMSKVRQQAIIAVSSQLEEKLRTIFPEKVRKIFNFIDVDALRADCSIPRTGHDDALQCGIVGRLVPVKRVDLFIDTIELLNKQGVPCRGTIIGAGPLENQLRARASESQLTHEITFKGFVNPAWPELKALDALLMTSDHEGLPMTLLEALALEVPVIAHNVGGIPEVLAGGRCGWLVDDHSPAGYAEALQSMLASPEHAKQKSQTGLEQVRKLFDRSSQTEKYLTLYQELC